MKAVLSILLCLLVLTGCSALPVSSLPESEPRETIVEVGGQSVVVDEQLQLSDFTMEDFVTVPETGRVVCLSREALTGVDVSYHQGEIDWAAVAGDGIDFAMLRIGVRGYSEGIVRADEQFEANYAGATENGLPVGSQW